MQDINTCVQILFLKDRVRIQEMNEFNIIFLSDQEENRNTTECKDDWDNNMKKENKNKKKTR